MPYDCSECGRPARKGGRQCSRCYQRAYRSRPGRREAHRRAVAAYQRRHYDRWIVWQYRWRERIGWRVPDLQALRAAIKAVDAAVAEAEGRSRIRRAGQ